jgi:transposase
MAKTYRPYVPEQDLLLPPSLRDWLPEGHLAFFVSDLIDQLDLSAITAVYEDEERGYPPYHPVMLTKVLVYAYCVGVFSSRKINVGCSRTSRSGCWQPATNRIFAPSPIFARRTCRR